MPSSSPPSTASGAAASTSVSASAGHATSTKPWGVPYERRGKRGDEFIQCLKTIWTSDVTETLRACVTFLQEAEYDGGVAREREWEPTIPAEEVYRTLGI